MRIEKINSAGLGQSTELYNLEEDIGESRNLAADYPDGGQEMNNLFKASHHENEFYPYGDISKK